MAEIKIEIDIQDAMDTLDALDALVTSESLGDAAGAFAVERILTRTISGKDVNDTSFASYSPSYARFKGGIVNLVMSGEMLGSVDYQAQGQSATIQCASETAQYHEGGTSKMPQRQFMGLSESDKSDMVDELFMKPLQEMVG